MKITKMTKEERREFAEEQAREAVAMQYNFSEYTLGKKRTWEESYKEALIVAEDRHQNLWENCLILQYKYKMVVITLAIQIILMFILFGYLINIW